MKQLHCWDPCKGIVFHSLRGVKLVALTEGIGCVQPIGGSAVILDIYVELLQEDLVFLLMFRHYMAVPKIYLALKLIVKHLLIAATLHSALVKAIS